MLYELAYEIREVAAKLLAIDFVFPEQCFVGRLNGFGCGEQSPHARAHRVQSQVGCALEMEKDRFVAHGPEHHVRRHRDVHCERSRHGWWVLPMVVSQAASGT